MTLSLFDETNSGSDSSAHSGGHEPLASRMRPKRLEDYIGQEHLLSAGKPLGDAIRKGVLHSMILWGPPGVGKTSFARLLATHFDAQFIAVSAVLSGVKDIRSAIEQAKQYKAMHGRDTILFVDEVHRFNKSQQDAFLPFVEDGTVVFVGATTENPSFELNNALLSRARVYILRSLSEDALGQIIRLAILNDSDLKERSVTLSSELEAALCKASAGDARKCLNLLELAVDLSEMTADGDTCISQATLNEVLQGSLKRYDKGGDIFYEQISALHKSVRGSDPDASLYWFVRMIDGGCDPLYIARRVVRMASEDIGNADPKALSIALAAWDVQERLGSPEGELSVAQAIVYLAVAPKSNAVYQAFNDCRRLVGESEDYDVPMHLRNAPTTLMKAQEYGKGYRYAHDEPDAFADGEDYFPEPLAGTQLYHPVSRGLEIKISEKLRHLREKNQLSQNKRWP